MDKNEPRYTATDFTAEADAADYVARFRDADRFQELCARCPAFGRTWACPPLPDTQEALPGRFTRVLLRAVRITPAGIRLPAAMAEDLIRPERDRLERELLERERTDGGKALIGIGRCTLCPDGCTRPLGIACRHPERVRPSLEAFGFDVARTVEEFFGLKLQWGADGFLPESVVIVGAVFR